MHYVKKSKKIFTIEEFNLSRDLYQLGFLLHSHDFRRKNIGFGFLVVVTASDVWNEKIR